MLSIHRTVSRPSACPAGTYSRMLLAGVMLAAMCTSIARPSSARQIDQLSVEQLTALLQSDIPEQRARAACRLADLEYRARSAAPALLARLGDETRLPADVCDGIGGRGSWQGADCREDDRWCFTTPGEKAARALTDIGPLDQDAVISILGDGNEHARRNAAWLLGAADAFSAVEALLQATDDEAAAVREQAAWALGAIGSERAADRLERIVDDPSPDVRENAAWALGAIGSERAVPTLERLARDSNAEVAGNAAWALGAIGDPAGVSVLVDLLSHDHPEVRENAAWALGAIGDESAVDPLIDLFQRDDNNDVRRKAMWALTAIQ